MQTGNTIFLGLGPSTSETTSKPYGWAKSLTSIICFCLGCFFFSRLALYSGPLRRLTLVTSFALQALVVFFVASLSTSPFRRRYLPVRTVLTVVRHVARAF